MSFPLIGFQQDLFRSCLDLSSLWEFCALLTPTKEVSLFLLPQNMSRQLLKVQTHRLRSCRLRCYSRSRLQGHQTTFLMQEVKDADTDMLFPALDSHISSSWSSEALGYTLALRQCFGSFSSILLIHHLQELNK